MSVSPLFIAAIFIQSATGGNIYYCTIKSGFVRAEMPDQQPSVISTDPRVNGRRMGFVAIIDQAAKKINISQSSHFDLFPIVNMDISIDNKSSVVENKLISVNHISTSWKVKSDKCESNSDCEIKLHIVDYGRSDFLYVDVEYPIGFKSKKLVDDYKSLHGACLPLARKSE